MAVNAQSSVRAQAWSGRERSRALGAVYTPPVLAEWVAAELVAAMPSRGPVWDIACGDGALLEAVSAVDSRVPLLGVDIDEHAVARARSKLTYATLLVGDGLTVRAEKLEQLGEAPPSAIILNPPWGAELPRTRDELAAHGFRTATGQFDSYDLFAERALDLLPPSGAFALIVPDSLLNTEHERLRKILIEETELLLVARLGEGFFDTVYRGVMVLVGRKGTAATTHSVRCFRLGPSDRRAVLRGRGTLSECARRLVHPVPQSRFISHGFRIELDVREEERAHLGRFATCEPLAWRKWLVSGRGVELSKRGLVVRCPKCATALPKPRRHRSVTCRHCACFFDSSQVPDERIVQPGPSPNDDWSALIVGEDVRRYGAQASRAIRLGVPGIAYKDDSRLDGPRLLVRKTGIGISAAVDHTGALTTQVVFHFKPLKYDTDDLLYYLMGLLNSRFMLAYYLRTRGDSEWRSHPYVTQQVIESLPIPTPPSERSEVFSRLAEASRMRASATTDSLRCEAELQVEALVAQLFGFDSRDWHWALGVLESAQSLEGIRELRLPRTTKLPLT